MLLMETARLLVSEALWSSIGVKSAGKILVHELGSADENLRLMSGAFLVRSGKKALPLLQTALKRREHLPEVLTVMADIGGPELASDIEDFVNDPDPVVASAARNALRVLSFESTQIVSNGSGPDSATHL